MKRDFSDPGIHSDDPSWLSGQTIGQEEYDQTLEAHDECLATRDRLDEHGHRCLSVPTSHPRSLSSRCGCSPERRGGQALLRIWEHEEAA